MVATAGSAHRPLVFGDGDRPIAFVAVDDVAALVVRVIEDRDLDGRTLEICGPEAVSTYELASLVVASRGWAGTPRRVPRPALHVLANTVGLVRPTLGRQVRAALALDRLPTNHDHPLRSEFPDLPRTPVTEVVDRYVERRP